MTVMLFDRYCEYRYNLFGWLYCSLLACLSLSDDEKFNLIQEVFNECQLC